MPRSTHASDILGTMYNVMTEVPILIIGAGGIGCELGNFLFFVRDELALTRRPE